MKSSKVFLVILVTLLFGCSDSSKSFSTRALKLTPEEQGIAELLKRRVDYIIGQYGKIVEARNEYHEYKSKGKESFAERRSKRYFAAFQKLANYIDKNAYANERQLIVPGEMLSLVNALFAFEGLWSSIDSNNLSDKHRELIEEKAKNIVSEDSKLHAQWKTRKADYTHANFSRNLTLEYGAIPFRIDFINNEVKIKYTGNIGPFKLGAGFGPSSRSGIKTLILQNGKHRRYFAVGGKPIQVHVPESVLTTNGSIMTITAI